MHATVSNSAVSHWSSRITAAPFRGWMRLTGLRLTTWVEAYARAAAEAALYQQLYRLSDAELERRGIPRGDLHRCVFGGMPDQAGQR
jgi:hypothetical protein